MALLTTGQRRVTNSVSGAPSRSFPDTPPAHATSAKTYLAFVTVPAADDAAAGQPVVQYLDTPAAHATDDKPYALIVTVTGLDTTGGSTAVPSWIDATGLDFTP